MLILSQLTKITQEASTLGGGKLNGHVPFLAQQVSIKELPLSPRATSLRGSKQDCVLVPRHSLPSSKHWLFSEAIAMGAF
jgi:hypothetical protein